MDGFVAGVRCNARVPGPEWGGGDRHAAAGPDLVLPVIPVSVFLSAEWRRYVLGL